MEQFYSCVATIMTHQLQSLCLNSISDFTKFICDERVRFCRVSSLKRVNMELTFWSVCLPGYINNATQLLTKHPSLVWVLVCLFLFPDTKLYPSVMYNNYGLHCLFVVHWQRSLALYFFNSVSFFLQSLFGFIMFISCFSADMNSHLRVCLTRLQTL